MAKEKVIIEVTEVLSPSAHTGLVDFNIKCYDLDKFLEVRGEEGKKQLIEILDRLKMEVVQSYKKLNQDDKTD
ncbi:hypothetical protein CMT52_14760 [Elizabethkingia anophelis]|jgi:hypothetical protein|nr:hypothetical protein [Elizabethkingia anophelis]